MKKTSVLFVYTKMILGGATTSLLSVLRYLPRDKYDIELRLFWHGGEMERALPPDIRVTYAVDTPEDQRRLSLRKKTSPRFLLRYLFGVCAARRHRRAVVGSQIIEHGYARFLPRPGRAYDAAVSYLELAPADYVATRVDAKRKIAWIHIDYRQAGMLPRVEERCFSAFDRIVTVSDSCTAGFAALYPAQAQKLVRIDNILTAEGVRERAAMAPETALPPLPDDGLLRLASVSRIEFASKALDRAMRAVARLRDAGVPLRFRWYVIGDGPDLPALKALVAACGLDEVVFCLGAMQNPLPLLSQMDCLFLPSLYEGKPMAVTEALLVGLPVIVTEYASARAQVRDGVDGRVLENSEDGVFEGLRALCAQPEQVEAWRQNVRSTDYGNQSEIARIEALLDGRL